MQSFIKMRNFRQTEVVISAIFPHKIAKKTSILISNNEWYVALCVEPRAEPKDISFLTFDMQMMQQRNTDAVLRGMGNNKAVCVEEKAKIGAKSIRDDWQSGATLDNMYTCELSMFLSKSTSQRSFYNLYAAVPHWNLFMPLTSQWCEECSTKDSGLRHSTGFVPRTDGSESADFGLHYAHQKFSFCGSWVVSIVGIDSR